MYGLTKICYLCLNESVKYQLDVDEDAKNRYINEAIHFVLPELKNLHPETCTCICYKCLSTIHYFYNFKKLCLKNIANKLKTLDDDQKQPEVNDREEQKIETLSKTSTNPLSNRVAFEQVWIKSNDYSDVEETFYAETSNFSEYSSLSRNEDILTRNIEDNNKEIRDTSNKTNKIDIVNNLTEEIEGTIVYKCAICYKQYLDKANLKFHLMRHANIRDYECSVCFKKYVSKKQLTQHMKYHINIKNFQCIICNKKFFLNSQLLKHMKICTYKIKKFKCSLCNMRFVQNCKLTKHLKTHGSKDFECYVCYKKFSRKDYLKVHLKIHKRAI